MRWPLRTAYSLPKADSLAAHFLVHADDRHTNVLCHVLCAVGNFAHAAAQVQHGIHAFLSGFHVHADQACCRCSGHIACRADICQNAGVLQAVQLHIIAQLLFDLLLHQFDQFRGGAGIDQTYLHNGKASFCFSRSRAGQARSKGSLLHPTFSSISTACPSLHPTIRLLFGPQKVNWRIADISGRFWSFCTNVGCRW